MKQNIRARLLLLFVSLTAGFTQANAQVITTYAGGDTSGYTGNGGAAIHARIDQPFSMVVDGSGNLYFSEMANHCIRKVNTSGTISVVAGDTLGLPLPGYWGDGGPATATLLNTPGTMGIDGAGNIYIAEVGNSVIRKINKADTINRIAGQQGIAAYFGDGVAATLAVLNKPSIAVDQSGNVFIADVGNHRIRKINTAGIITTIGGTGAIGSSGDGGPALSAMMSPQCIAVDTAGNVFFVDSISSGYRVIRKISTSGTVSLYLNTWANAITFDNRGNLYFSDISRYIRRVTPFHTVQIYAGNGANNSWGDSMLATQAGMKTPMGMAFDSGLNLYVAEFKGSRIRKITYLPSAVNNVIGHTGAMQVYPNPANGAFVIVVPSATEKASIIISDMAGRLIESRSVPAATGGVMEDVNTKSYAPGTYIINVVSGDNSYTEKIVVR